MPTKTRVRRAKGILNDRFVRSEPAKMVGISAPLEQVLQQRAAVPADIKPLSVIMIAKNCAPGLTKCVESLKRSFLLPCDEVLVLDTGSTDETPGVAKALGCKVVRAEGLRKDMLSKVKAWLPNHVEIFTNGEPQFDGGCIMDFSEARQISMDQAANDIVFWIDSDDELVEEHPGELRMVIQNKIGKGELDCIFLDYHYSHDKSDGKVTTILKRERAVNRKLFVWKGPCHETLCPKDGGTPRTGYGANLKSFIRHTHRPNHQHADIRNYCIIRNEIEEAQAKGESIDTRSIFYLGNASRGLGLWSEARDLYRKAFALSGSRDDRYSCLYYTAFMYLAPQLARPLDALELGFKCIQIKPEDPRGYFLLSRAYALIDRWQEALHWFTVGRKLPEPVGTLHSYDPEQIHMHPFIVAAKAALELGDIGKAAEFAQEAERRRPSNPDVQAMVKEVQNRIAGQRLRDAVTTMVLNYQVKDPMKARREAQTLLGRCLAVPPDLERSGVGKLEPAEDRQAPSFDIPTGPAVSHQNEAGETVVEIPSAAGRDITIYCGHTAEAWGPKSRETGIGGSEKMVLEMGKAMQAVGHRVTVYANVPIDQRGKAADGVVYRHFGEFDADRSRDVIIYWRQPGAVVAPLPAKKRIIWCHDVQNPANWTPEVIATVDQAWLLSEFHAQTLGPKVRAALGDRLVITRNGIDASLFRRAMFELRRPNRIVFCSSPDRGSLTAIQAFKKADLGPTAELHIGYGFGKHFFAAMSRNEYMSIPDLGRDANGYEYVRAFYAAVDSDPRIHYHGRLNWVQLSQLMLTSGVWLYPTRFPEISCMAAMEAQAAGCVVVATDYAALKETINWGHRNCLLTVPETASEALKAAVSVAADDPARKDLAEWAQRKYDFALLAQDWTKLLNRTD